MSIAYGQRTANLHPWKHFLAARFRTLAAQAAKGDRDQAVELSQSITGVGCSGAERSVRLHRLRHGATVENDDVVADLVGRDQVMGDIDQRDTEVRVRVRRLSRMVARSDASTIEDRFIRDDQGGRIRSARATITR